MTPTTTSAAGTDPAFIPGVPAQLDGTVPPALRGTGKPAAAAGDGDEAAGAADADETRAAGTGDAAGTDGAADDTASADAAAEVEGDDADDADVDDGKPVFEVSDRRGSIAADRHGITFTLDSEIAEFGWDEIGAVEIDTPRFGRRFSVTVYTSSRRWFQADVEAASRKQLREWTAELDAVLDVRFEGSDADADGAAGTADTDADSDAAAENAKPAKDANSAKSAKSAGAAAEEQPESADA